MPLLLCRQEAALPYYIEKLDMRIGSLPELCYVIYNYPLLLADDLMSDELISWIRNELSMGILAEMLEQLKKSGAGTEEMLYRILREGNYFTLDEINRFKKSISFVKGMGRTDLTLAKAASYFRLGKYSAAREKFAEAERLYKEKIKRNATEEPEKLYRKLSDIMCDEAVCLIRLFDDKGALMKLKEGAGLAADSRCAEYLYLLDDKEGRPFVSDEKRAELEDRRDNVRDDAEKSPMYREILAVFDKDSIKRSEEIKEKISEWKKEYRKMV